jgi:hypothetical protein
LNTVSSASDEVFASLMRSVAKSARDMAGKIREGKGRIDYHWCKSRQSKLCKYAFALLLQQSDFTRKGKRHP